MAKLDPFSLQMQITRMFEQGQSFFATTKVQEWLKEHNHNPVEYDIIFHQKPAPPGSKQVMVIEIELRRKDGQPVDPWLQAQANLQA
jgi:dsRNA-specific ribonuclease